MSKFSLIDYDTLEKNVQKLSSSSSELFIPPTNLLKCVPHLKMIYLDYQHFITVTSLPKISKNCCGAPSQKERYGCFSAKPL